MNFLLNNFWNSFTNNYYETFHFAYFMKIKGIVVAGDLMNTQGL